MKFANLLLAVAALGFGCILTQAVAPPAPARAAETETAAPDRDAYLLENEGRLERLGRDIDRLGDAAGSKGAEASREAKKRIDETWVEVKKQWQALRSAGIAGWREALEAYEKSLRDYERARAEADI